MTLQARPRAVEPRQGAEKSFHFCKVTDIRIQPGDVLTKVHPVAAKKEEERPLLLVEMKEVKEEAGRRQQQILKEEENRVGRKKEQKTHPWRRSFVVAPMK